MSNFQHGTKKEILKSIFFAKNADGESIQRLDFLTEEEYAKEVYLVEEEDLDNKNDFLPIISVILSV